MTCYQKGTTQRLRVSMRKPSCILSTILLLLVECASSEAMVGLVAVSFEFGFRVLGQKCSGS